MLDSMSAVPPKFRMAEGVVVSHDPPSVVLRGTIVVEAIPE